MELSDAFVSASVSVHFPKILFFKILLSLLCSFHCSAFCSRLCSSGNSLEDIVCVLNGNWYYEMLMTFI